MKVTSANRGDVNEADWKVVVVKLHDVSTYEWKDFAGYSIG